jgi:O-antigen ligase/polysaccharide polymerase Wzy-like membrane protein
MPRRVKLATLLAFGIHGMLILTHQYRLSYDAYNHMFFADHYLQDWWSLWEPRWYTGFEVTSYPPLVHQLIALLGRLIGVDAGYALLLWMVATAYPLAVYAFGRVFTRQSVASYAALGAALLPSIYLAGHVFGQLPTLVGTLFALFGSAVLADFLRDGDRLTGALAVFLFAVVIAAHHATLLFLPWLIGVVFLRFYLKHKVNRLKLGIRFSIFAVLAALAMIIVIWPFWDWGRSQVIQTPIDHLSRHNFFTDPMAWLLFFLPIYGLLIPLIPFALWMGRHKRYLGLGIAFLFFFVLGLGGTTPLPHLLFGANWAWLTYDRFAFWASLILLPFFGVTSILLLRTQRFRFIWKYSLGFMALISLVISLLPSWMPLQPRPLDMQPIVDFLAQADHGQYRYVTFGFGDQLAYLSRLTDATTIDGSYHTARTLPELRTSGIAQIDSAYWIPGGTVALDPILKESTAHGVRWAFVNLKYYFPILHRNGWIPLKTLSNSVQIWENPAAILPSPVQPPTESPIAEFSWGTFPLMALFVSGALAVRRYWTVEGARVLSTVQAFAISLLPLGLTFWYYRTLFVIPQPRLYFTYTDALFFASDGLALIVVLTWFIAHVPNPKTEFITKTSVFSIKSFRSPDGWLFALCVLASLSTLWSLDWRTSLYISLHLWLCFGLYLALRDAPQAWRWFTLGCCAALVLQAALGIWEFAAQSTGVISSLGLNWPGDLSPAMIGASVVQLATGARWLRAYGTLPHPNLLGGFMLVLLAAPIAFFLLPSKQKILPLILFNIGLVAMVLTFSRSTWLGLAVAGVVLLIHLRQLNYKNLILIASTGLITIALIVIPLRPLFFTRFNDSGVQTEQVSNYTRLWLIQRTVELIQQHPLLGSGIGSYSLALSKHVAAFYKIEPVHNVPLLAMTELGIGGIILSGGLAVVIFIGAIQAHGLNVIVLSGALLGLLVISFFDHYLWTLAPGRMLLFTVLGLWAGQTRQDERRA